MSQVADSRCPRCGALVRAAAQWCTLCYADLRPPAPALADPTVTGAAALDPLTAPLALLESLPETGASEPEDELITWPCSQCGSRVALDAAGCPDCGAAFMEGDAESDRLANLTSSPGTKLLIMIGGSVVVGLVFFAILFLIASLA